MKKLNQKGFSAWELLIIVTVLALIGGIGWYVIARKPKQTAKQSSQTQQNIQSFDDCKKAGYPVQESYPETCKTPDGKSYTNSAQAKTPPPAPVDETANWLLYTSANKTFKMRLPDGWKFTRVEGSENIYARGNTDVVYTPGHKATVTTVVGGWDGPSDFSVYVPGDYASQIVHEGTQQGTFTTTQGLAASKFYMVQATDQEMSYTKDSKIYSYYFDAKGKYIQVQHVVSPGQPDQDALVEKALKTLEIQ